MAARRAVEPNQALMRDWKRSTALIVALTTIVVLVAATVLKRLPDSSITVEVELTVENAGVAELFVNVESNTEWQQAGVVAGRQTLTFGGIDGPLRSIRVDPLAVALQHVTIHRVRVLGAEQRVLATFSGTDFASWITYNADSVIVDESGLSLTTTTVDAAALSIVDIRTSGGQPKVVSSLVQWVELPWSTTGLVLGLPIGILAIALLVRHRGSALLLLIGPIAVALAIPLAGSVEGVTPADQAFGQPGWVGRVAAYPQHFLLVCGALVLLACCAALVIARQLPHVRLSRRPALDREADAANSAALLESSDDESAIDIEHPGALAPVEGTAVTDELSWRRSASSVLAWSNRLIRSKWFAVLLVPVAFAVVRMPSARGITSAVTGPLSPASWDEANLRTWDHFFAHGLRPMVDFYYPYGNLIYLRAALFGAVATWISETLCLVVLSLTLWRLSRRSVPVLVGTLAVAALNLQFYTGGFRYLFPMVAAMWFATTRRDSGFERWAALACVSLACVIAVDVGVYTLAAVVGIVAVDELTVRGLGGPSAGQRLLRDGGAIAAGLLGFLVLGLLRGGLGPTLALVLDQRTNAAYVGAIEPVRQSIEDSPRWILYTFPFTAIGLGLYHSARRRDRVLGLSWAPVCTGLGVFGTLILAKHILRPGLDGTLAMICVTLIAVACASMWPTDRSMLTRVATGALLGTLIVQAQAAGSLSIWRHQTAEGPSHLVGLLGAVTWNRDETSLYRVTISRGQMTAYPEEVAAADAVTELVGDGRLFVLGDAQFLYPLTEQPPYWVTSMWEASPLADQRRVVRQFEADPPDVVVVDRRDLAFDGVPSVIRVPLLYDWVIERYELHSSTGPYDLLTPAESSKQIDWAYWRATLGDAVDLGRLPAAATADRSSCDLGSSATSDRCLASLTLDVKPVREVTVRSLSMKGSSGLYTIAFAQWPGDEVLRVPLGRLWFWTADSVISYQDGGWISRQELAGVTDNVLY
jgi:hypothetical protein